MNICIIPARGGSKRIPRKNIRPFHGKPIIAYSIEAAQKAECFDEIIISTDDEEIAGISRDYGAKTPFLRPKNISDDYSTTLDVIQHAINWLEDDARNFENVCCIYPTAPLLFASDIKKGLQLMEKTDATYAFSATSYAFPIQRAFFLNEQKQLQMFEPQHANTRSQDLVEAYHDAGQFYWGKKSTFLSAVPFFSERSRPVFLPRNRVQDIDTIADWQIAELMFESFQK